MINLAAYESLVGMVFGSGCTSLKPDQLGRPVPTCLKGLFHPACLVRVVSWLPLLSPFSLANENGDRQRPTKRRHVQGMLGETDPLRTELKKKELMDGSMDDVLYLQFSIDEGNEKPSVACHSFVICYA